MKTITYKLKQRKYNTVKEYINKARLKAGDKWPYLKEFFDKAFEGKDDINSYHKLLCLQSHLNYVPEDFLTIKRILEGMAYAGLVLKEKVRA